PAWVGDGGIRLYAHGTGGTFSARRVIQQARLASDEGTRLAVVYRMYQKRFPDTPLEGKSLEQVRGMEGIRVRRAYQEAAKNHGTIGLRGCGQRAERPRTTGPSSMPAHVPPGPTHGSTVT